MEKLNQKLYLSPEVEVIETQVQSVLCQSNEPLERDNMNWNTPS